MVTDDRRVRIDLVLVGKQRAFPGIHIGDAYCAAPGLPGREHEIPDVGLIDDCAALHALHLGLQVGNGVVRSDDIEHDLVGRGHGQDYRAQVVDDCPGRILDGRP